MLKRYKVIGWQSNPDNAKAPRKPMKEMHIDAPHAQAAAEQYARSNQIPAKLWNNGSSKPPIVIRVG